MTIKEAAKVWGITERRVNELCKSKRIPGAVKEGNRNSYTTGLQAAKVKSILKFGLAFSGKQAFCAAESENL